MKDENITDLDKQELDVVIVGGGPAGITAGIRCRTHQLSVLLLEARKLGGQLTQLYPTKFIYDFTSHPEIRAGYLADLMIHHAKEKGVKMLENIRVTSIESTKDGLRILTEDNKFFTKTVILAIGMGIFEPSKLKCKGEDIFEGKGIIYAVPNLKIYRGQKIIVAGGGDTAVENAIGLSQVAKVTLIHRRERFRATETNMDLLKYSLVEVLTNTEIKEIKGNEHVRQVTLFNNRTNEFFEMDIDTVVINIGFSPDLSLVQKIGVKNNGKHILIDGSHMHTNIPRIFACGDIVEYPGKTKQILPATGEAFTAAEEAYKFIKKPYWAKSKK